MSALSLSADPSMFRFLSILTSERRQLKIVRGALVFEPPTVTPSGRSRPAQFQKIKDSSKIKYFLKRRTYCCEERIITVEIFHGEANTLWIDCAVKTCFASTKKYEEINRREPGPSTPSCTRGTVAEIEGVFLRLPSSSRDPEEPRLRPKIALWGTPIAVPHSGGSKTWSMCWLFHFLL